eukprot:1584886-Rhodomonas_salina.2
MERATRKVFRAWEDFEVFDAIDKPISVGNFDEGDGEEARMMWGNEAALGLFKKSLEQFQKIHNYNGNSQSLVGLLTLALRDDIPGTDVAYGRTRRTGTCFRKCRSRRGGSPFPSAFPASTRDVHGVELHCHWHAHQVAALPSP